jgi:DNA-binding CsgD family transcriptional regulator
MLFILCMVGDILLADSVMCYWQWGDYSWGMSRHSADEIANNPELHAAHAARRATTAVPQMSAAERGRRIVLWTNQGYRPAQIAKVLGITRRGVETALTRIREGRPGRIRAE